jgi:hypothetical protein
MSWMLGFPQTPHALVVRKLRRAAAREQLADSEQRAEEEHLLATRLQHAITPRTAAPLEAGGLNVAARYLPAGPPSLVCGDWYDAVMLPSKEVLLAVGDVAGHGIDAVTGMVALRNALRGLAMTGATPATLVGWLNAAACHLTDGIVGTALCGIDDPGSRTLHWARAGHLPPIVVRAGDAQPLELPHGVLLGADPAASYDEATTSLQPGDILLLYTDGLIERRDESLDAALRARLMRGQLQSVRRSLDPPGRPDARERRSLMASGGAWATPSQTRATRMRALTPGCGIDGGRHGGRAAADGCARGSVPNAESVSADTGSADGCADVQISRFWAHDLPARWIPRAGWRSGGAGMCLVRR